MEAKQTEQDRITEYAAGWKDAVHGRPPRSLSLGYSLGYMDATR